MKKIPLIIVITLLLACIYAIFIWQPSDSNKVTLNQTRGGDFQLQTNTGSISLNDFKGKVLLIYFGYTMCPDICPTNLSMMSNAFMQIEKNNPDDLKKVQGLFISVDPERDTPERLAEYTHYFHQAIMGATSDPKAIRELATRYGAAYQKAVQESAANYSVDHSSETYVLDPSGKLVERLPHAAPPEEIISAINKYLK